MEQYFDELEHKSATLVELLRKRAFYQPQQKAYTFLIDGKVEGPSLVYAELDSQARAIGALLQQYQAQGERALLLYPSGLEFITAFWGCLYSGVIAIPVPPPDAARLKRSLPRLQAIATDAQATLVLTTSRLLTLASEFPHLRWLSTTEVATELAQTWCEEPGVSSETLAYLQYTSGSTATPKGVMISHGNLVQHCAQISSAWGYTPDSIAATWMPYFHDYGLVDGLIQPLYQGIHCFVMSPLTFIKHPLRWLQTISQYKVTHSQGPNFAYEHCLRRIKLEECSQLDLRSWRTASNGAEPIRKETLERFVQVFAPYGFQWSAFYPAYGLAEATLLVSTKQHHLKQPICCNVLSAALEQNLVVQAKPDQSEGIQTIIGCGHPINGTQVVIVNPETLHACADNQVGEVWVSAPGIAQGYWNRLEETQQTFRAHIADTGEGPFMRTGDLGFLQDGELFITGRLKDLIVIRGRNHYPQDIEFTVEQSHPALRPHCCAAFSVDVAGEERLVVVQEVERHYKNLEIEQVVSAICQAVAEHHEVEVYAVLLLRTGSILKTSSGKIQRRACRAGFLDSTLDVIGSWTTNHVAVLQQPTLPTASVPDIRPVSVTAKNMASHPPTVASVPANDGAAAISKERADRLIDWLRPYANERINSRLIDERRCIPPYVVLDFGNQGILGMQVSEAYGGLALKNCDALRVIEQLAGIDLTLATFVCINNFLGIRPIQRYASETLRNELLPLLARGRELAAFALTEPGAGSNPRAIRALGTPDGAGGWRLRGTKIWSGSASWAGVINVFVQLVDAHAHPQGVGSFVVRQGTPGLRQGPEALTMGMRGVVQNAVYLDDVAVNSVDLLGEPGTGMTAAQDAMLFTRLAIGAMSVGGMKRCAQLMLRYATRRDIATGRLIDNPVTLVRLGQLTAAITAVETLVHRIAQLLDTGTAVPVEAYIACKTSGPELLWQAADSLVQLLGGRGYIETNIAPQILRDARVFRIFEGPTETLNMFLGSRLLHQSTELQQFLCSTLKAASVWNSLWDAAVQINTHWSKSNNFSDRASAQRWASMLIGELATYAILQAAVQDACNCTPSTNSKAQAQLQQALTWVQAQFEITRQKALSSVPVESLLLGANTTKELISNYTESIGELEQTLAGEDDGLDELLSRRQIAVASPSLMADSSEAVMNGTKSAKLDAGMADDQNNSQFAIRNSQLKRIQAPEFIHGEPKKRSVDISSPQCRAGGHCELRIENCELQHSVDISSTETISQYTAESIASWLIKWLVDELAIKIDAIDRGKPLTQYGLDSVTAVTLVADLELWLGRQLSLNLVGEKPSIAALAQYLAQEGSKIATPVASSALVRLKPGSDKPPLFCIYGILLYQELANHLSCEQAVYGVYLEDEVDLLKAGRLEQSIALTSVTARASLYLEAIRKLQPTGPYFLAGESFGGLVAFEMAQLLHQQGETVALLALFDSPFPGAMQKMPWSRRVHFHLQSLLQAEFTNVKKVKRRIKLSQNILLNTTARIYQQFSYSSSKTPAHLLKATTDDIRQQFREQIMKNYIPSPYPGKIILFRAKDVSNFEAYCTAPQRGWNSMAAGGLEVYQVPGDHIGILKEPHVRVLADKLQACLEQAQNSPNT